MEVIYCFLSHDGNTKAGEMPSLSQHQVHNFVESEDPNFGLQHKNNKHTHNAQFTLSPKTTVYISHTCMSLDRVYLSQHRSEVCFPPDDEI